MLTYGESQASAKHPNRNEDAYFFSRRGAGVFDGLGGYHGSEHAARQAATMLDREVASFDERMHPHEAEEVLRTSLHLAHCAIKHIQLDGLPLIGTTAAVVCEYTNSTTGQPWMSTGHSGDSRIYVWRRDGSCGYRSLDHREPGSIADRTRTQSVLDSKFYLEDIDPEDKPAVLTRNMVSSFLGKQGDHPEISTHSMEVAPGDLVLLTSDGVHDNLTFEEIEWCVTNHQIDAPKILIARASARSQEPKTREIKIGRYSEVLHAFRPKHDDMTAVVGRIGGTETT